MNKLNSYLLFALYKKNGDLFSNYMSDNFKLIIMKNIKQISIFCILLFTAISVTTCSEDYVSNKIEEALLISVLDDVEAIDYNEEITNEVEVYLSQLEKLNFPTQVKLCGIDTLDTLNVTIDIPDTVSSSYPKTITLDFSKLAVSSHRNYKMKGEISVILTQKLFSSGAMRKISFSGLKIQGYTFQGTIMNTYNALNELMHPVWAISSKISFGDKDGRTIGWNGEIIRERIDDSSAPEMSWASKFHLKGSSDNINGDGRAYTTTIDPENPILICCPRYITKGKVTFSHNNKSIVVDYGDGTIDNTATTIINSKSIEIIQR